MGKVALVTGAAGIIGPSICSALKATGWRVAASERTSVEFERFAALHHGSLPVDLQLAADLRDPEACQKMVTDVVGELGGLDLIVNNATANNRPHPLETLTPEFCHSLVDVDLLAPLWLAQAAESSLAARHGAIVNISSVRVERPEPGSMFYTAVKAGLEKLTETLALSFRAKNIRVNAIRVGAILGDAFLRNDLGKLPPELATRVREHALDQYRREWREKRPDLPSGVPQDIADTVCFLASEAARFINGTTITVDGGFRLSSPTSGPLEPLLPQRWQADPAGELDRILESLPDKPC